MDKNMTKDETIDFLDKKYSEKYLRTEKRACLSKREDK